MMRSLAQALVALAAITALIAPTSVRDAYESVTGHGDPGQAPVVVITPDRADAPVSGERDGVRARRAAAAPAGAYGVRTGRRHHRDLFATARWNPCAAIRLVYNPAGAPAGAVADLRLAARKVSQASGLRVRVVGRTNAAADPLWAESRGRSTWNPVLVNWGRHGHGVLDGDASATAEPVAYPNAAGQYVYTSGQVTFNVTNDHLYTPGFGTFGSRVALYMHELAHIVGLDHVEDPNQLMYGSVAGARDFGAGDLAGLARLGSGDCLQLPSR